MILPLLTALAVSATPLTPPNLYTPPPPVIIPTKGIHWPAGQAIPTFARPATTLDTIDVQTLTRDEQLTFSALQGLINRSQPRIYLIDSRTDEGRDTWANTPTVNLTSQNLFNHETKYQLLAKYLGETEGVILYDATLSPHYRNLAGTIAGLKNALPVTSAVMDQLHEHNLHPAILTDLTTLTLQTPTEIYSHLYDHYWPDCTKRLIVSARPTDRGGDYHHTRDMAAATRAAILWLDGRIPEERTLMRKFFGDMKAGEAIALGWYSTERSGITTATEFGIGTMPADHFISSTIYATTGPQIAIPPVPKMPPLENKVYVAIFISDGDNIQYTQRAMRKLWDATANTRGLMPLTWTIAPGLVDIGPGILNYYYSTATPNDCFATGPSGMGYAMPYNTLEEPGAPVGPYLTEPDRINGYTSLTATYLQRSGIRVITIWDDAPPPLRAAYAKHCRSLYGATVQNFKDVPSVASSVEINRLRFEKLVIPYASTYEHLHRSLSSQIRGKSPDSPLFLAYQMSVWQELKPTRLVQLREQITQEFPNQVVFVRADHYFNLFNQANALPYNLSLAPHTLTPSLPAASITTALTDGTPSTLWQSPSSGPVTIDFDLGQPHMLSRCLIRHAGANGLPATLNTRRFELLTSLTSASWTPLALQEQNQSDVTDIEVTPTTTRYVRLHITDPGSDTIPRIADIELYGTPILPTAP